MRTCRILSFKSGYRFTEKEKEKAERIKFIQYGVFRILTCS